MLPFGRPRRFGVSATPFSEVDEARIEREVGNDG